MQKIDIKQRTKAEICVFYADLIFKERYEHKIKQHISFYAGAAFGIVFTVGVILFALYISINYNL